MRDCGSLLERSEIIRSAANGTRTSNLLAQMKRARTQREHTLKWSRTKVGLCLLAYYRSRNLDEDIIPRLLLHDASLEYSDYLLRKELKTEILSSRFNLGELDDYECFRRFRFGEVEMRDILRGIRWDNISFVTERGGYRASGPSSPCRWKDLEKEFFRSSTALGEIFYHVLELFYQEYHHLVTSYHSSFIRSRSEMYASKIFETGAPLDSFIGFIDGSTLYICKPKGNMQCATCNGQKRRNCFKFQAMTLPDGLMFHVFGPVEGRRHDLTMFRNSRIEQCLQDSLLINGRQFYVYADSAYILRPYMMVGFRGADLGEEENLFNRRMSSARMSVEWAFKEVKKYFSHLDHQRNLRIASKSLFRLQSSINSTIHCFTNFFLIPAKVWLNFSGNNWQSIKL